MRNDNTQQKATCGEKEEDRPPSCPTRDQAAQSWSNNRSERRDHPNIGKAFSGGETDKQIAYNREGNDWPCRSADSLKETAKYQDLDGRRNSASKGSNGEHGATNQKSGSATQAIT